MVLGKALQNMPSGYSENPHDYINFTVSLIFVTSAMDRKNLMPYSEV